MVLGAGSTDVLAGATLVARLRDVPAHWAGWVDALGVAPTVAAARLTARLVAINLLPATGLTGGRVVTLLLPESAGKVFTIGSMLGLLGVLVYGLLPSACV